MIPAQPQPASGAAGAVHVFKLVIVGDGGTGKTTFVKRHKTGEFERNYDPTIGVETSDLHFWTQEGQITFKVWDTAGQEKFGGLRDGYYIGADCGIVFFDVTSRNTYRNVANWLRDLQRMCPKIPIVLVGNKIDSKDRKVMPRSVIVQYQKNIPYHEISAKTNFNIEKPFLSLARRLLHNNALVFVNSPALLPPTVEVDREHMQRQVDALDQAMTAEMPGDADQEF